MGTPGADKQSFIERFVEKWFETHAHAPSFRDVFTRLDGITAGWHGVTCSTPPAYLLAPGLAAGIMSAAIKAETPWTVGGVAL